MLHVTGIEDKRHILQSLFFFPKSGMLHDILTFDTSRRFSFKSARIEGVSDSDNTLHRVRDFLETELKLRFVPHVEIDKRIPKGSGLGGGASDAALFCRFAMRICGATFEEQMFTMRAIGQIGADIPIFLDHYMSGESFYWLDGTGVNLGFEPIDSCNISGIPLIVTTSGIHSSSREVFSEFSKNPIFSKKTSLDTAKITEFLSSSRNDLQACACMLHPEIKEMLDTIRKTDPLVSGMSGSGSSCFAIFEDSEKAQEAYEILSKESGYEAYVLK